MSSAASTVPAAVVPPTQASSSPASSPSSSSSSPSSKAPPPNLHLTLDKTTIVCDKAVLSGTIVLGPSTIIHPTARLVAPPSSSITVGSHCLIEESVLIEASANEPLVIGNWNLIECGATVRASIGHANHIRTRASIDSTAKIGRGVEVGVGQRVSGVLPDGSLLLHDGLVRAAEDIGSTRQEREKRIMELLQMSLVLNRDLLPKAHRLLH